MSLTQALAEKLAHGPLQIGQIVITSPIDQYAIRHVDDYKRDASELRAHKTPESAREIGTLASNGDYRFTKGQLDLKSGWIITVNHLEELRRVIDAFYPASLGLWQATESGRIRVQSLRDKLNRQTGMYRYARTISDAGAQKLVSSLCGPGNNCVKKILWQIDENTPLEESDASRFNGCLSHSPVEQSLPLVCQEACNFFVSECRKAAKKEFEAAAKD